MNNLKIYNFKYKTAEDSEPQEDERVAFENSYYHLLKRLQKQIAVLEVKPSNNDISQSKSRTNICFPTIKLPSFFGNYEDWVTFYDTFNSLVHSDENLSDTQKFHYLKSALVGQAATVQNSLSVSANNYIIAWDTLKSRYENKRLIIHQHIKGLFNLPSLTKENHAGLRQILDGITQNKRALQSLGRPVDGWDDLLIYIISSKLDPITLKEWETSLPNPSFIPEFSSLVDFLNSKCQTLESIANKTLNVNPASNKHSKISSNVVTSNIRCIFCSETHFIHQCERFTKLSTEKRIEAVRTRKLCLNCLRSGHRTAECKSSHSCKTCRKKHHTLLHLQRSSSPEASASTPITTPEISINNHVSNNAVELQTLLSTALILIKDVKGHSHECRALLDSGSQSNFITKSFSDRLGIKQEDISIPVVGINEASTNINKSVNTRIFSRVNAYQTSIKCLVINKITGSLPTSSISLSTFNIPKNIKLADPEFNVSKPIDMLIGVDLFWKLMCIGQIKSSNTQPCLRKTHFGWIIAGTVASSQTPKHITCNLITNECLEKRLSLFWEQEECAYTRTLTLDEMECENHFNSTFKRNEEGRFIVKLPFNRSTDQLGDSYSIALKRFLNLEKRLNKSSELKQRYRAFLKEYQDLNHMKLCNINPLKEESNSAYYLPHHAVEKLDSTTTKLRVVFDGSSKTSTGIALNDLLFIGPTLQEDLFSIVTRFRFHKFALTADIAKMYRQVLVDEADTRFQRILWRSNQDEEIKVYELSTVTYGTTSASYLAIRSMRQLSHEEGTDFPVGAKIILRDFYVDDLLSGANTVSEAKVIIEETTNLLKRGGFELRKWHSNHPALFSDSNKTPANQITTTIENSDTVKALGLSWNATEDNFLYYPSELPSSDKITKRSILSFISQLFDPLGLLGPVIIVGKILMQRLWQLRINWDESLPLDIYNTFLEYERQFSSLNNLHIPRRIISLDNFHVIELHGFCDASQNAYGACVYVKSVDLNGNISSNLLCAKSKVAPIKSTTIPRLELCGALLLCKLIRNVVNAAEIRFNRIYYWTDSTVALGWIRSTSRQWKTYVANRVSEIHELSDIQNWHHVRSEDNPADIISRGSSLSDIIKSNLWWHGPTWLLSCEALNLGETALDTKLPEEKTVTSCLSTNSETCWNLFSKSSSLNKLIHVTAYCLRFITNLQARCNKSSTITISGNLTTCEINAATNKLIQLIQGQHFGVDLSNLMHSGTVDAKSKLLSLNPFVDSNGIIRVGGRLRHANLPYSHKHPIILPAKHQFTLLLIEHYHKRQLHAGLQGTIAAIRCNYWPLNLRNTTKHILRQCITCFRVKPRTEDYIMGNLPSVRITQSRPFINTGVDFCGPFQVRERHGRNKKIYKVHVAIFICLSTKAIHTEIVNDLTSVAFLNALKRFIKIYTPTTRPIL